MKQLRRQSFLPVLISLIKAYALILILFLLLPFAARAELGQRAWAGSWLVVGEGDAQLVWQLHEDGSGYAYGFLPSGQLSHGFAITWELQGDRVRVRTGSSLRCNGGMVTAGFTGAESVTLDFAIVDGRHWVQDSGRLLAFQRRLTGWQTPRAGAECPTIE